ncbi:MAG TPA: hypothetical protein VIV55_11325 [Flavobacterium sp.]
MDQKENKITSTTTKNSPEKPLNNEWDKYLEDYYNYTKEYIIQYKKSLQGNSISLSIYPYLKVRSEVLYEQLFDARQKSQLTETQIKRLDKIQIENSYFT